MKRVNLDPDAPFVGNRPPKPEGVQLIRRHDQRRPLISIEDDDGDTPRGAEEAAEESRRQAKPLEASAPKPGKAKKERTAPRG